VLCCRSLSLGATGAAVVEWSEWLAIAKVQQVVRGVVVVGSSV
jgi:hypothetical protein